MVLPDSPRWLIAHGYKEEGARVIAMLEDRDSPDHPDVVRAQKEIELSLEQESAGGTVEFLCHRIRFFDTPSRTV